MNQQFARKRPVPLCFEEIRLPTFDDMKVFPVTTESEILKADFKVRILYDSVGGELK
jgi:hypothetical protein